MAENAIDSMIDRAYDKLMKMSKKDFNKLIRKIKRDEKKKNLK